MATVALSRQRCSPRFRPATSLRLVITGRSCRPPLLPRSHAVVSSSIAGRCRLGAELPSARAGEQRTGFLLSFATLNRLAFSLRRAERDAEPSHRRRWSGHRPRHHILGAVELLVAGHFFLAVALFVYRKFLSDARVPCPWSATKAVTASSKSSQSCRSTEPRNPHRGSLFLPDWRPSPRVAPSWAPLPPHHPIPVRSPPYFSFSTRVPHNAEARPWRSLLYDLYPAKNCLAMKKTKLCFLIVLVYSSTLKIHIK
jgi:hypothetical protein